MKLFIIYLGVPFGLQYILFVILGGVGQHDGNRKSEVGKAVIGYMLPNAGIQNFMYLCLIPFLSIIYSLRDTIADIPNEDHQSNA